MTKSQCLCRATTACQEYVAGHVSGAKAPKNGANKGKREAVKDDEEDTPPALEFALKTKQVQVMNKNRRGEEEKDGETEVALPKPRAAAATKPKKGNKKGKWEDM